jgi:hypothetical protein
VGYNGFQVSAPLEHTIVERIRLAEETARVMWRSYEAAVSLYRQNPSTALKRKVDSTFGRCLVCDEHLARLKKLRAQILGANDNAQDGRDVGL